MKHIRAKVEAAGLARFSVFQLGSLVLALCLLVGSWVQLSFNVVGLSLFSILAILGAAIEGVNLRAKLRSESLAKLWPEVLDSLQSAASSGFSVVDSLDEVARSGPKPVRSYFKSLVERIDSGQGVDKSFDWFKAQFGQVPADRFVELIRITQNSGGVGYVDSLKQQSANTRSELALWGELESKQGWVTGTAKLAIVAPWIIVGILSSRPENVAIYNTSSGMSLLLFGLVVSAIAYRLVTYLGALSRPRRVFTK